ncbi:MAG TPA: hypothetical protein VGH89_10460 [Pseudonocardia sp.]|jgi:hypothetical protein
MSPYVVLGLVLLPAVMYGLALALNVARTWLGVKGLPKARSAVAMRVGALRKARPLRPARPGRPQSGGC